MKIRHQMLQNIAFLPIKETKGTRLIYVL